jgi:hypothetical protein
LKIQKKGAAVALAIVLLCLTSCREPLPANGAYLGVAIDQRAGEATAIDAIHRVEAQSGTTQKPRKIAIDHVFRKWNDAFPKPAREGVDVNEGRIPFINWAPRSSSGIVSWPSIANGSQDSVINQKAEALRDLGSTVYVSFNAEPFDESTQGWGKPADFVAAFRHIVEKFRDAGATNVRFSWVMTDFDFLQKRADAFYPGDDVLDWIGVDGYNFYARSGHWQSMQDVLDPFFAWYDAKGKTLPVMIPEWATEERAGDDHDTSHTKAAWLRDAAAYFKSKPAIKAVVYFDLSFDAGDHVFAWQYDSSPEALKVWHDDFGQDPAFAPLPPTT